MDTDQPGALKRQWSDEHIEAARCCVRAATLHPRRYRPESDIPVGERRPTELDPLKLMADHLRRSREELASEHLRAIAALPTRHDAMRRFMTQRGC